MGGRAEGFITHAVSVGGSLVLLSYSLSCVFRSLNYLCAEPVVCAVRSNAYIGVELLMQEKHETHKTFILTERLSLGLELASQYLS